MITQADLQYLNGADVYAPDGEKIGSAGRVYLDNRTGEPEWISVRTGVFGTRESLVPLTEATLTDERLEVPYDRARVKDAPQIDADGDLSPADEDRLYTHFGRGSGWGPGDTASQSRDPDDRWSGRDISGPTTSGAMTRSEERHVAGTRTERSGNTRLRKYLVTEQQSATVSGQAREQQQIDFDRGCPAQRRS